MNKPTQKQIDKVSEKALLAFWEVVAKEFPEVKSGDFPPDATFRQTDNAEASISTWLEYNHPALTNE